MSAPLALREGAPVPEGEGCAVGEALPPPLREALTLCCALRLASREAVAAAGPLGLAAAVKNGQRDGREEAVEVSAGRELPESEGDAELLSVAKPPLVAVAPPLDVERAEPVATAAAVAVPVLLGKVLDVGVGDECDVAEPDSVGGAEARAVEDG